MIERGKVIGILFVSCGTLGIHPLNNYHDTGMLNLAQLHRSKVMDRGGKFKGSSTIGTNYKLLESSRWNRLKWSLYVYEITIQRPSRALSIWPLCFQLKRARFSCSIVDKIVNSLGMTIQKVFQMRFRNSYNGG